MTLLIAAAAGLVGHICVVPLHAHAAPLDGHGSHDDDAADHSVHTASCEAARGGISVNALLPPSHVSGVLADTLPRVSLREHGSAYDVFTAESPPLFLLHASLLI